MIAEYNDIQVLTYRGWKPLSEIVEGIKIYNMDGEGGIMIDEITNISKKSVKNHEIHLIRNLPLTKEHTLLYSVFFLSRWILRELKVSKLSSYKQQNQFIVIPSVIPSADIKKLATYNLQYPSVELIDLEEEWQTINFTGDLYSIQTRNNNTVILKCNDNIYITTG